MTLSRRECSLMLLPALLAQGQAAKESVLASKFYPFAEMPLRTTPETKHWSILDGKTHEGMQVEMHQTELAPGAVPHPPHRHEHEEVFFLSEGTLEVLINGRTTTIGPGSAAFVASNEEHGVRNVGKTAARYFVVEMGTRRPAAPRK